MKDTYLAAQFRRLVGHRGRRRARRRRALDPCRRLAHPHRDTPYRDLGAAFIDRIRKSRQTRRLIGQLTQLGYDVTLEPRSDG